MNVCVNKVETSVFISLRTKALRLFRLITPLKPSLVNSHFFKFTYPINSRFCFQYIWKSNRDASIKYWEILLSQ